MGNQQPLAMSAPVDRAAAVSSFLLFFVRVMRPATASGVPGEFLNVFVWPATRSGHAWRDLVACRPFPPEPQSTMRSFSSDLATAWPTSLAASLADRGAKVLLAADQMS